MPVRYTEEKAQSQIPSRIEPLLLLNLRYYKKIPGDNIM